MIDFQLFESAYIVCIKQPNKYLSANFKKHLDKLFPQDSSATSLKTPMVTGYYLRCTETLLNLKPAKKPDQQIQNILNSKRNTKEKTEEIANYLDKHNKIGLSEKIADYSLIPFEDTRKIFEAYAEDFVNNTLKEKEISKDNSEIFHELAYRNMAFGYLYKLAEEFIEKKSYN
ncbi:MAG: hypothetical protein WC882_02010 [Candidatus Gracilibacteria bacterium]